MPRNNPPLSSLSLLLRNQTLRLPLFACLQTPCTRSGQEFYTPRLRGKRKIDRQRGHCFHRFSCGYYRWTGEFHCRELKEPFDGSHWMAHCERFIRLYEFRGIIRRIISRLLRCLVNWKEYPSSLFVSTFALCVIGIRSARKYDTIWNSSPIRSNGRHQRVGKNGNSAITTRLYSPQKSESTTWLSTLGLVQPAFFQ